MKNGGGLWFDGRRCAPGQWCSVNGEKGCFLVGLIVCGGQE